MLAFDHCNFGESVDRPRQHTGTCDQVEDLRNAASYTSAQQREAPN